MIRLRTRRSYSDPMDSGSLTDLAFLLIIYFIVIACFNVNKGFLMDLPEESRPKIVMPGKLLKIELDGSGGISRGGDALSTDDLEGILATIAVSSPDMTFLLIIDRNCPYQKVVDVIGITRRSGIENFSFRLKEDDSP